MLRDYQRDVKYSIYDAWRKGARVVCAVLPTGSGKTVLFSDIIREHTGASCAIAHRQELVTQISLALARESVPHRIIGPKAVIKLATKIHMREIGRSWYDPRAQCAVAGVDTIIRRGDTLKAWADRVTLWVQDECHHLLKGNKWGKAIDMFPHARGLGVTATPMRADGKGLGVTSDGFIEELIVGPGMRDLIHRGYLTDYRIFYPSSDINLSQVKISQATGDYNKNELRIAVHKSRIVGDVVSHYLRIAPGKLGVTFAVDVEAATGIAAQYNASGVPAEVVHAKTPDAQRVEILNKFRERKLLQLVNVDIFGEGFDLPAIEVVSMARPTQSYVLYVQVFGRGLRPMPGKSHAIIIDHVGNVLRHGLPDKPRVWSLARRERQGSATDSSQTVKVCPGCTAVYERIYAACPYCGYKPTPARRDGPEYVDGDLTELDPATLAKMRGEVEKIDMDKEDYRAWLAGRYVSGQVQMAQVKNHVAVQEAQAALRETIAWWAGLQRSLFHPDSESYRKFYLTYGIDVLSAQALRKRDAEALNDRIRKDLHGQIS